MPASDKNNPRRGPNAPGARGHNGEPDHPQSTSRPAPPHLGPDLLDHLADVEEGRRRRDEGMAVARAATHTGWRLHVDEVIADLAASGATFTAEDVRAVAGDPLGSGPSAMGAAIGAANRRGLIEPVGFVLARRPEAHARPLRLWQGVSR